MVPVTIKFKPRPDGGVPHDAPAGAYWFKNREGGVQIIIIGPMRFMPRQYAQAFMKEFGGNYYIDDVKVLIGAPHCRQSVLDRGFYSLELMPQGTQNVKLVEHSPLEKTLELRG